MPTLLILAAGMGSRYGGLKQIDAFGPHDEAIIDYSIYDARRAGFGKVVFVIRRHFEAAFVEKIGRRYAASLDVDYAYQELDAAPPAGFDLPPGREKPWGTGHAILVARHAVREPFAVINADDFYGADGYRAAAQGLAELDHTDTTKTNTAHNGPARYCMVGYRLANTLSEHGAVSRGVCQTDDTGRLTHVVETHGIQRDTQTARITADPPDTDQSPPTLTGDEVVSMNLWGFTPSVFDHLDARFADFLQRRGHEPKSEFYIPFAVNDLIQSGRAQVRVLPCEASWFGVTYRDDKPYVELAIAQRVAQGEYPSPLWP